MCQLRSRVMPMIYQRHVVQSGITELRVLLNIWMGAAVLQLVPGALVENQTEEGKKLVAKYCSKCLCAAAGRLGQGWTGADGTRPRQLRPPTLAMVVFELACS